MEFNPLPTFRHVVRLFASKITWTGELSKWNLIVHRKGYSNVTKIAESCYIGLIHKLMNFGTFDPPYTLNNCEKKLRTTLILISNTINNKTIKKQKNNKNNENNAANEKMSSTRLINCQNSFDFVRQFSYSQKWEQASESRYTAKKEMINKSWLYTSMC